MGCTSRGQHRRIKGRYGLKNRLLQTRQRFISVHFNIIRRDLLHTVMAPLPYQNTQAFNKARDKNAKRYTE